MQDYDAAIWDRLARHDAAITLERIERITVRRARTAPSPLEKRPVAFEEMPRALPARAPGTSLLDTGLLWLLVSLVVLGALGFLVMPSGSSHGHRHVVQAARSPRADAITLLQVRSAVAGAATNPARARAPSQRTAATPSPVAFRAAAVKTVPRSAEPVSYVTPAGREVIRAPAGYLNATDSPLLR